MRRERVLVPAELRDSRTVLVLVAVCQTPNLGFDPQDGSASMA